MAQDQTPDFALPKHFAYIWHDGQGLRLMLPGFAGARGHTVRIPLERLEPRLTDSGAVSAQGAGIVELLRILQARASAQSTQAREEIGRQSAITQDQLDKAMRGRNQGYTSTGLPKEVEVEALGELDI